MERDEFGTQESIFPASGNPVVPLTEDDEKTKVADDEKTLVASEQTVITLPRDYSTGLYAAPMHALPEEALSFTVNETTIRDDCRKALQPRGLLRLKESYISCHLDLPDSLYTIERIDTPHVELLFAVKPDFVAIDRWEIRELSHKPKSRIPFSHIECVVFKRWSLKPRFIIKLKPEETARFLVSDPIIREVVLHISHKDARLAEKLQAAIMMEVSNANLQRLLKAK